MTRMLAQVGAGGGGARLLPSVAGRAGETLDAPRARTDCMLRAEGRKIVCSGTRVCM